MRATRVPLAARGSMWTQSSRRLQAQDPLEPSGCRDAVRLGGAYFDGSGALQYQWEDMAVPASADEYFVAGTDAIWPATPKTGDRKLGEISRKAATASEPGFIANCGPELAPGGYEHPAANAAWKARKSKKVRAPSPSKSAVL
jgi:hypothetical protein